jgi:hypothetical protein
VTHALDIRTSFTTNASPAVILGSDEWAEAPFILDQAGDFHFFQVPELTKESVKNIQSLSLTSSNILATEYLPSGVTPTAFQYHQEKQSVVVGTSKGTYTLLQVRYQANYNQHDNKEKKRVIDYSLEPSELLEIGRPNTAIEKIACNENSGKRLVAVVQKGPKGLELHAANFEQTSSLMGGEGMNKISDYDLTTNVIGTIDNLLVPKAADLLFVSTKEGQVYCFTFKDDGFLMKQILSPFKEQKDPGISRMDFIFGDSSINFVSTSGLNRIYNSYPHAEAGGALLYDKIHELDSLKGPASF